MDEIHKLLNELNINYEEISHKKLYTIEDAINENIESKINGMECKNLFVKNKNNYYLIFIEALKKVNLKDLKKIVNENNLRFASEEELKSILSLDIGSVTPLGIINDKDNKVTLLISESLKDKKVLVHPLDNSKTMSLEFSDLIRIIEYLNHKYIYFNNCD